MRPRRWVEVTIDLPLSHQDLLTGQLAELGFSGFLQEDRFLACYLEQRRWGDKLRRSLSDLLRRFRDEFPAFELRFKRRIVPQENWNARWERTAGLVDATDRIVIKHSWKRLRARDKGKTIIHIDPKMSFGTGHHETTRLCLRLLEESIKPNMRVLDFGSGTGILAIAAVKLGASSAVALDNDEWAIENSKENVKLNRESRRIKVVLGQVKNIPAPRFDLIVANIDFPTISTTFHRLLRNLKANGVIILSGILNSDLGPLMNSLSSRGAVPVEMMTENEWAAVSLIKVHATNND